MEIQAIAVIIIHINCFFLALFMSIKLVFEFVFIREADLKKQGFKIKQSVGQICLPALL